MSSVIKKGRFTYYKVGGHYERDPPEKPPRTYMQGLGGKMLTVPLVAPSSGGSSSSRMPPVQLRKPPYNLLSVKAEEEEEEEELIYLPPLKKKKAKKVKKEVPSVIRGVNLAGEETDTEYEYEAPRKRVPLTSNVVVTKKSKPVQTTTKMSDPYVGVYTRVSSLDKQYKTYRYFKANDTTGKNINKERALVLKNKGIPFVDKTGRPKRSGVSGAPIGDGSRRRARIEDVGAVLGYDRELSERKNKVGRPDARLIPSSHIRYVAREYNISPADVSGIITDMDNLAIAELKARKSDEKYKRVVYKEQAPRAPSKSSLSKARRAELIELLG